jgi:hypothetical protein
MSSVLLIPRDGSEAFQIDTWQSWDTATGDTATEYPVENEEAAADAIIKGARSIQLSCVLSRADVEAGAMDRLNALRGMVLDVYGPDGIVSNVVILSTSHSVNSGAYYTRAVSVAMRTIGIGAPVVLQKAAPPPGKGKAKPKDKGQATAAAKPTNRSVLKKLADGAERAMKALGGGG